MLLNSRTYRVKEGNQKNILLKKSLIIFKKKIILIFFYKVLQHGRSCYVDAKASMKSEVKQIEPKFADGCGHNASSKKTQKYFIFTNQLEIKQTLMRCLSYFKSLWKYFWLKEGTKDSK